MAEDSTLTKIERNQFIKIAADEGLTLTEFKWDQRRVYGHSLGVGMDFEASVFRHEPTGFYFCFGPNLDEYCPGLEEKIERKSKAMRPQTFLVWVWRIKEEIDAPDLWAELANDATFRAGIPDADNDNTLFDAQTKESMLGKLEAVEKQMATHLGDAERDREFVKSEFEYLRNALDRLGKKDWRNITTGVLVRVGTSVAIEAAKSGGWFHTVKEGFNQIYNNLPQLPPGAF